MAERWVKLADEDKDLKDPVKFLYRIPANVTPKELRNFVMLHDEDLKKKTGEKNEIEMISFGDELRTIVAETHGGLAKILFTDDGRQVIKTPLPHLALTTVRTRLLREKYFLQRRNHDRHRYWPKLYEEGQDYAVLELIPGVTLRWIMEHYPQITRQETFIAACALQVAHALEIFEEEEISLRDIHPKNLLLVRPQVAKPFLRLFDANSLTFPGSTLTNPNGGQGRSTLGIEDYMAPEVIRGQTASQQSDLYALGCVLYEMLRGHAVFEGLDDANTLIRHVQDPVPLMNDTRLGDFITSLLRKNPEDRPSTTWIRFYLRDWLRENAPGDAIIDTIGPAFTEP